MKEKPLFLASILFLLFFFAYHPVIYDLRDSVLGNELAHHTPLVFALAGFLIYRDKQSLTSAMDMSSNRGGKMTILLFGLVMNLLGQAAGIYYLAQISIPVTLYGMSGYLFGKDVASRLVFPLAFLLLAFPIPGKIYTELTFPLKLLVTHAAGLILALVGYSVKIYGNVLDVSSHLIGVIDACSGLSSLMAILTLSIFFTYLTIRYKRHRLFIVLSMLPLVMIANIVRVITTALITIHWGSEYTEGAWHTLWGMTVFVVSVLGLAFISKLFITIENRGPHAS